MDSRMGECAKDKAKRPIRNKKINRFEKFFRFFVTLFRFWIFNDSNVCPLPSLYLIGFAFVVLIK